MYDLVQLFLLALLGSLIALAGGVIFLYNKTWSNALEKHSIPFAAGVLITVALLGLLPEASEMIGEKAFLVILISFFCAFLFERLCVDIHHHEHTHPGQSYRASIPLVIVGDTIHNFIDGVAIGASFLINPGLGLVTALSTFLHEIPHEIGDFGILLKAGWKKTDIIAVNIISASLTIVGAFSIFIFAENTAVIGTLLSISAGIFLYLGAIDFLPHIDEGYKSKVNSIIPLTIGILIMVATLMAVPHEHEEEIEIGKTIEDIEYVESEKTFE
jgi:zinc and cadmium transporter